MRAYCWLPSLLSHVAFVPSVPYVPFPFCPLSLLLHRNRLSQVSRLVDVGAPLSCDVVGKKLGGDGCDDGGKFVVGVWDVDYVVGYGFYALCPFVDDGDDFAVAG